MVTFICNPSTQEAEWSQVWGQHDLHSKILSGKKREKKNKKAQMKDSTRIEYLTLCFNIWCCNWRPQSDAFDKIGCDIIKKCLRKLESTNATWCFPFIMECFTLTFNHRLMIIQNLLFQSKIWKHQKCGLGSSLPCTCIAPSVPPLNPKFFLLYL